MSEEVCQKDPDYAMGAFLAAFITAAGEYTAAYRVINQLSEDWSTACVHGVAQGFLLAHNGQVNVLMAQLPDQASGEPPKVN